MQPLHQADTHHLPGNYSAGTTFAPGSPAAPATSEAESGQDPALDVRKLDSPADELPPFPASESGGSRGFGQAASFGSQTESASDEPVPVVRVLSVRGVEYGMMTIALWVAASTAAWVVLNLLNGSGGFDSVVVPVASLIICVPVFGLLFLRLKKAELVDSRLRLDPSKRRWSQTTQFLAFIGLLVNFIYFVYVLLQHASGGHAPSVGKSVLSLIVVTVIAGGVLAYYWRDEHRLRKA